MINTTYGRRIPGLLTLAALAIYAAAEIASSVAVPPSDRPYLVINKSPTAVFLTVNNTIPSARYQIQTNSDVTNPNGWGAWLTVTASNSVTPLSALGLDVKEIFFRAVVMSSPGLESTTAQRPLYLGRLDISADASQNPGVVQLTSPKDQSDDTLPGWGRIVNPDGDCNFYVGKEGVVINVPGTPHDLAAEIDRTNAPRVLQRVNGDFTIQVRTDGRFEPGDVSTQDQRIAYNGAAIIIASGPANVLTLARAVIQSPGKRPGYYANFELRSGGELQRIGLSGDCPLPTKGPVFLRLQRRGSQITGAISLDGAAWHSLGTKDIPSNWPATLDAGIAAISTSDAEFNPRFSKLSITK